MKTLIILRGIPGSGKSTIIKNLYPTADICSADHYHMKKVQDEDGGVRMVYDWQAKNQGKAHTACYENCHDFMVQSRPQIVVDNTNINGRDYKPYVEMAHYYGYAVWIHEVRITTEEQIATCIKRNVHRVPAEIIRRMSDNFKDNTVAGVDRVIRTDMVI